MRAIVVVRQGGPEVMELKEVPEPEASSERTLVRVHSAGVNFADALSTRGLYAASPPPPFVPGLEVAGTAVEGGRPVMAILPSGGYAEVAAADPRLVIPAGGLDCKGCCLAAYEAGAGIDGVMQATASFKEGLVTALIDPTKTNRAKLEDALRAKGVQLGKR